MFLKILIMYRKIENFVARMSKCGCAFTSGIRPKVINYLLLIVFGITFVGTAWGQKALPYSYGFEETTLDTEGWTLVDNAASTGIWSSAAFSGSYGFRFFYNTNPPQYLISPQLTGTENGVNVSFYYKDLSDDQYVETFYVGYSTSTNSISAFTWDAYEKTARLSWVEYYNTFPAGTKYIAVKYTANDQYHMAIDDFSFTVASTPARPTKIVGSSPAADEMTWTQFASYVNSGYSYAGKTVTLEENINITATSLSNLVGSSSNPFRGTFDGKGHKLTVNINISGTSDSYQGAAPFSYIRGATIKNLEVSGSVQAQAHHAGGLVSKIDGNSENIIYNCLVHTNVTNLNSGVNNKNFIGGIIGQNNVATTYIIGCVYDGMLKSQAFKGGMFGFTNSAYITIRDSYFCGDYNINGLSTGYGSFSPVGCRSASSFTLNLTLSNFYENMGDGTFASDHINYNANTNSTRTGEAKIGYTVTGVNPVTVAMSGASTTYSVSGIIAYSNGMVYNGTIYAGSGDVLNLTLGGSTLGYFANHGTLSGSTLTMEGYDTKIFCPATIPYSCNFEDGDENEAWTLNRGSNQSNKWYIGTATNHGGSKGLYISNNAGTSNVYEVGSASYVYACRAINFASTGNYLLSFDWRAYGEIYNGSGYDLLRAFLVPASLSSALSAGTSNGMSAASNTAPSGWIDVSDQGDGLLYLKDSWQSSSKSVAVSSAGVYYLVFFWKNDGSSGTQPPAAIDNVNIQPPCDEYYITDEVPAGSSCYITWTTFCENVNAGNLNYQGKTFKLVKDISVSTMAGTSSHPFNGIFDGQGKKLTVTISSTGGRDDQYKGAAPFHYIRGTTIKNLIVDGTVTATAHHAAGLVGYCVKGSTNTIQNCRVSTNVTNNNSYNGDNGDNYIGGLIGHNMNSATSIVGCVYDGTLTSQGFKGGMVGFADDYPDLNDVSISITDSYFGGGYSANGYSNPNFSPVAARSAHSFTLNLTASNSYYNTDAGTFTAPSYSYEGSSHVTTTGTPKHGYTIKGEDGATVAMRGTPIRQYDVSGLNFYESGFTLTDITDAVYGGNSDELALGLSYTGTGALRGYLAKGVTAPTYTAYTLSGSAYTGINDAYTFNIPTEDVKITPKICSFSIDDGFTYIWRGIGTEWTPSSNWYVYDPSNRHYTVAASLPTNANYYICNWGGDDCALDNWPSLNNPTTIVNNLKVADGSMLTIPVNKILNITGNLYNEGTFSANNAEVVFNGNTNQSISNAVIFNNVTFAQTGEGVHKITANNGITVNGVANFTNGIVDVGGSCMTFSAVASCVNAGRTSYVEGSVSKASGASEFLFPTGSGGVFGSVLVPASTAATISFHHQVNPGFSVSEMPVWWNQNQMCDGLNHVSNFGYWEIETASPIDGVKFTSTGADDGAHFNHSATAHNADDIFMSIYNNATSCWRVMEGDLTVLADGNATIEISGVTVPAMSRALSPISFGSKSRETLLPIELISFTATCNGKYVELTWTTASERNNEYFVIERSDDAVNFTEIARLASVGNSIKQIDYSYNDYGILGGDNYYRLVQVDYDGTRTASEIVVATCVESEVGEPDVQAYPNPFNGELTLLLSNFDNRPAQIEVYDMLGKLIVFERIDAPQNSYEMIMNLSNLPPAAYNVRVSTADFVINKQIVKQ